MYLGREKRKKLGHPEREKAGEIKKEGRRKKTVSAMNSHSEITPDSMNELFGNIVIETECEGLAV